MNQIFKKIFILIVFLFTLNHTFSQAKRKILLTDIDIQIDATEAVNHLYNFRFEEARKEFNWIKYRYPNHPMPYFLIGFTYWWRMQPNIEKITQFDKIFISYMDSTIMMAEKIYDEDEENIDAIFFLSSAYGFLARIHGERGHYTKAILPSRRALNYMEEGEDYEDFTSEFLFGEGLFNYYEPYLKENYSFLKPVLWLFDDGDKELGIKQLQKVSSSAFYTRTEAQYYLIDCLDNEGRKTEALETSRYLENTFPNNPVFQKDYAKLCFNTGRVSDMERVSLSIISKIDSGYIGYDAYSGRQAAYFIGRRYLFQKKDTANAKVYLRKNIEYTESIKMYTSTFYQYSLFYLGEVLWKEGKKDEALNYFKKVKKYAERKDRIYKESKNYLKGKK